MTDKHALGPWVVDETNCPYKWPGDDGTVKQCVERGHCGCDEQKRLQEYRDSLHRNMVARP